MSVANRVRRLLDNYGHSYAEAEKRTGVSRETIRRIVAGQEPPRLPLYLRKIAEGYGVDVLALTEGLTPKGEFEWNVRHAPPAQRLEWVLMTPAQRVKLTLDFLSTKYPSVVSVKVLAAACGMGEAELRTILRRWEADPPARRIALDVAEALHNLTGISQSWFVSGRCARDWEATTILSRASNYTRTISVTEVLEGVQALLRMVGGT